MIKVCPGTSVTSKLSPIIENLSPSPTNLSIPAIFLFFGPITCPLIFFNSKPRPYDRNDDG